MIENRFDLSGVNACIADAPRRALERAITEAYVGIDTTAFLLHNSKVEPELCLARQRFFLTLLEDAARCCRRRVWTSDDVVQELIGCAADCNDTRAAAAQAALDFIRRMAADDLLQVVDHLGVPGFVNAKRELLEICRALHMRSSERLTVLTQRADLARALQLMNHEEGIPQDKRLSTLRVTGGGNISPFHLDMPPMRQDIRWPGMTYQPAPMVQAARRRFGPGAEEPARPAIQPLRPVAPCPCR